MSEYMFGVGRVRVSEELGMRIDNIARKYGASFVWTFLPGEGYRYWFACPNQGDPFDKATRDAVIAALNNENIEPPT